MLQWVLHIGKGGGGNEEDCQGLQKISKEDHLRWRWHGFQNNVSTFPAILRGKPLQTIPNKFASFITGIKDIFAKKIRPILSIGGFKGIYSRGPSIYILYRRTATLGRQSSLFDESLKSTSSNQCHPPMSMWEIMLSLPEYKVDNCLWFDKVLLNIKKIMLQIMM